MQKAMAAFAALSQETRLRVFRLLVRAGGEGMSAGDIARELGVQPATLSFHLKELGNAGLLSSRRESRMVLYWADVEGVRGMIDYLTQDCCQGRPDLCGFETATDGCADRCEGAA